MDRILNNGLAQLGCNDKHIRLYRASMAAGAATLPELAKAARLQRSTVYILAAELVAKGLLIEDHKAYRKQYVAAEPDVVLRMLEARHRQLGRTNLAFRETLPELHAAHQSTVTRPRVRTFEGKAGLLAILKDILQTTDEILIWTNQASERNYFENPLHEQFIRERIQKKISARVLTVQNSDGVALVKDDAESLRITRILPNDISFTTETYIYGDKVAVIDVNRDIFGVITQNAQIADSQRAMFELVWQSLS